MEQLRYRDLILPPDGRVPIPTYIRDLHRARVKVWEMMGAGDWTAADWNVNAVGTGAAALAASNGGTMQMPCLSLTASAATDGYGARHNALHLPMPSLGIAGSYYVCFELAAGTLTANVHRAFGIATGTAANAFNVDSGALFAAGGGILWSSLDTGTWSLTYKPSAKSAVVIAGPTSFSGLSNSLITRLGFLVAGNPLSDANSIAKIFPFAYQLADTAGFQGDNNDDQEAAIPSGYLPSPNGLTLNDTDHGDAVNTNAGIFIGHGTNTGSGRNTYIRRIISVDNLRR